MTAATSAEFIAVLRRQHLLEPGQQDEVERTLGEQLPAPKALARELLKRGWLTPYQANQLLQGQGQNLVLGSYVLLERLGEGGMGAVFKARNWKLGQTVALKLIRKERLANADSIRRFQREIRAAAQLNHPNIVRALDADEVAGTHLLVMEYVEGIDLGRLVKDKGRLPVVQACDCIRQAALGLNHAHEKGLIHRDIKPANLLTTKEAAVKILDMGLARLQRTAEAPDSSSTLTQEGLVMGSLDFIAPEQALDSRTVDIRADLYSLGCTFYFLLTGQVPFPGGESLQKLMRHREQAPVPVEQLRPEVPPEVGDVVRRLMAKKPEHRFQTPAELAELLDIGLRTGAWPEPPQATPVRPPPDFPSAVPVAVPLETPPLGYTITEPSSAAEAPAATWRQRHALARRRQLVQVSSGGIVLLSCLALVGWLLSRQLVGPPPAVPQVSGKEPTAEEQAKAGLQVLFDQRGNPDTDPKELWQRVLNFRRQYPGSPQAVRAAELLVRLPSPLDSLDPARIPEAERWSSGHPQELVAVLGEHQGRHFAPVRCTVFSPDGKVVASGGEEAVIRLWDAATLREKSILRGHISRVNALAFAPDRQTLASGSDDGTIRLWDVSQTERKQLAVLRQGPVTSVAFSPNGQLLAAGSSDASVTLWDLAATKPDGMLKGHLGPIVAVAFAPDGRTVASASHDKTVRLWDVAQRKERIAIPVTPSSDLLTSLAYAPDGLTVAAADYGGNVSLWEPATGKAKAAFRSDWRVLSMAFAPDSKTLALGTGLMGNYNHPGAVKLWDVATTQEKLAFTAYTGWIWSVAFSPDGTTVVSGSNDQSVRLWDAATGKARVPFKGTTYPVATVAFAPDAKTLVSGTGQPANYDAPGEVKVWNLVARSEPGMLKGHTGWIWAVAYAPDGKTVASASNDATIRIWEMASGKEITSLKGHEGPVFTLAYAPDGKRLASSSADKTFRLWRLSGSHHLEDGQLISAEDTRSVAFAPNGKMMAAGTRDGIVRLSNVTGMTSKIRASFKVHSGSVNAVVFSPDSQKLASGSSDQTIRLWNLIPDKSPEPLVLKGHKGEVTSVVFAPDGKTLVSGDADGRLILWDMAPGKKENKLREWELPGRVLSLAMALDGRHLATGNGNGTIYLFRLAPR